MRKLIVLMLLMCLLILAACNQGNDFAPNPNPNGKTERTDEPATYPPTNIVLGIQLDEPNIQFITSENYDMAQMKECLHQGGIVVDIRTKTDEKISEKLDMAFSVSENTQANDMDLDSGRDIATLYYKYGDNFDGVYVINVGTTDIVNQDDLINEAVGVIRARQAASNVDVAEEMTTETHNMAASTYTVTVLGTFDVTTIHEPKGKLHANYKVYTVQDYYQKDYYIVKATVTGYPGCVMGADYESKYQGEGMYVSIGTSTTSVTVDDYGPLRDTTVSVSGTPTSRTWDIQLDKAAQESVFDFSPGVIFDCPYNKASVDIPVYASYDLDSWNTFVETIYLSKVITCNSKTSA